MLWDSLLPEEGLLSSLSHASVLSSSGNVYNKAGILQEREQSIPVCRVPSTAMQALPYPSPPQAVAQVPGQQGTPQAAPGHPQNPPLHQHPLTCRKSAAPQAAAAGDTKRCPCSQTNPSPLSH